MTASAIRRLRAETRSFAPVISGDPQEEAAANLLSFTRSDHPDDQDPALWRAAVGDFFEHVHNVLPAHRRSGPVTAYCWYDDQAGQLRFCVRSAPPGDLPFARGYELVDLEVVLRQLLQDRSPGLIPWSDLVGPAAARATEETRREGGEAPMPVPRVHARGG